MNVGPMGSIGGAQQEAADRARQSQSEKKAEQAGGIGEAQHDEGAGDRDADGRRIWEENAEEKPSETEESDSTPTANDSPPSKDPSGQSGNNLDLRG